KVEIQTVGALIERWHAVGNAMGAALEANGPIDDADVRRWIAAIGRLQIGAFMRLASAIWAARGAAGRAAPSAASVRRLYRRMRQSALRDPLDLGSLAVDGDDLRRAGIPAGPGLGKILQALLDAVVADPARNTTDWLLQEGRRLHAAGVDTARDPKQSR